MELIQSILNGSPQAQEILYEKYKKSVRNFLKNKYSIYYDLDDDVSEIMIKVFMKLNTFDSSKSKFRSWVFSIAKNHMVDKWRNNTISLTGGSNSNCVFSYSTTGAEIDGDNTFPNTISTTTLDIGGTFTTNCCSADFDFENCSSINFITNPITPQDYTLLDMKYVQGYDYKEIGSEFNVSSNTISNRVNYIKTKLKKNNPEME